MAHENATPRPWYLDVDPEWTAGIDSVDGKPVVFTAHRSDEPDNGIPNDNDAALIVEAVNAYDTLRAERDALWKQTAILEAQNRALLAALKPFASRGNFSGLTQVVTLASCQRARDAYDGAHVALFGAV